MDKRLLVICVFTLISLYSIAQNRTIDGSSNNLQNTEWGASGTQLRSITTNSFNDGISSPGGINRPNPRIISNTIFAQDSLISDAMELSDFTWVFGQFIDHDVISTPSDATEDASISVDFPDQHFNPGGAFPNISIHMSRSLEHPGTGTSTSNPRGYTNNITSWIDGSGVYGSDADRASYLRTFVEGKLKTSTGNLLPFNTDTHEQDGTIDAMAPFMENENPFNDHLFVAGDSRANENVALSAFHTIFMREHNRLCDELVIVHPTWTDEELYQHARKMLGGFIQSIVYNEWLPVMGVHLPPYGGYDASNNPTITNVFSAAAFRLGHTLLSGSVPRMDNQGSTIPEGDLTLLEAFFAPYELVESGGVDPIFKGMATQIEQELDCKMVDDVRNFLFGPPQAGLGGLDLAAININRGRERGLPDFNTLRQDMGLTPYASFEELNADPEVVAAMENLYGDVNDIDPWVGLLAEDHMNNALFGPTIMSIMEEQFLLLREGDRFYFENDQELTQAEKDEINSTTFRDIIMRNTGITVMQMNVFEAMSHDSICPADGPIADILGGIQTFDGDLVEGVDIEVTYQEDDSSVGAEVSNQDGSFLIEDVATCDHYNVAAEKNINHGNGVSTFDIIFMRRHILEIERFDNAYKFLSADVNNDGNVSTIDMVDMRKVILNVQDTFTTNKSWRFIDESITFADQNNPEEAVLDQSTVNYFSGNTAVDFIGLKIGDVTGDANPAGFAEDADSRDYAETFKMISTDRDIEAGKTYSFSIQGNGFDQLAGLQFALNFDPEGLVINEIIPGNIADLSAANFAVNEEESFVSVSWDTNKEVNQDLFFTVNITAKEDGLLSDFIKLNAERTIGEAYTSDLEIQGLELVFENNAIVETSEFELFQNNPNPFVDQTSISFNIPDSDDIELAVYDVSGRKLFVKNQHFAAGYNAVSINKSEINATGILYYQINSSFGSQTKKMILMK